MHEGKRGMAVTFNRAQPFRHTVNHCSAIAETASLFAKTVVNFHWRNAETAGFHFRHIIVCII